MYSDLEQVERSLPIVDSLIFDLDGTLWDTTHIGAKAWLEAAFKYNVDISVTAERLKGLYGLPTEAIAKQLLPLASEDMALSIMKESCEKQCLYLKEDGGILYPGVVETLSELKKTYRMFIVSNCQEGYIQSFIMAHQLEGFFEDFEYPGRTGLSKAANIRLIVERNSLTGSIYIGDTLGDATASHEAGIPFVYARYGFGNVGKEYDGVIDAISELMKLSILK